MAATDPFALWLAQAQISEARLTPDQRAVLAAAFHFRQRQGDDYYSTRLLSHFLLHCGTGLKVAQIARLLRVSRPTASKQQGLSAKQAIQQAHHRMDGRPYGKLLPRYAGPIAQFLCTHPDATRADLIDFVSATFAVRVSRIALYKFLKKYGLDHVPAPAAPQAAAPQAAAPQAAAPQAAAPQAAAPQAAAPAPLALLPTPAPPFCAGARSTPALSC